MLRATWTTGLRLGPHETSTQEVQVREGQQLTVFGTVQWVPPQSELRSKWGLGADEAKVLGRKGALYVASDSVRTVSG